VLSLKIAARFLRTSPVQSVLIILGIAVGIAVQIFVGVLIDSLQASLFDRTIGAAPHITLQAPKEGDPITYSPLVKRVISAQPGVTAVVPERDISALYVNGTDKTPLQIKGGELADLNTIYQIRQKTVSGSASLDNGEIMVGTGLAGKYGLMPGDPVNLVLASNDQVTMRLTGTFDLGSANANERAAFTGPTLPRQTLGYRPDQYSLIAVQLSDPFKAASVADDWSARLPGVKVTDWQADNKDLLAALQSQSSSSYMIQAFVLVAVALGIASTLAISAVQKTRQIGILKALGMSDAATGAIFLWEAAILGVVGTSLGALLGWGLLTGFTAGTANTPSGFPIVWNPAFIAFSCLVGISVALLSAIIPTRKTARLDPIEVIQNA
jgi:lipoprotein-releasing system permease protein